MKVIRTDGEIECPCIDDGLRKMGLDLVKVPADVTTSELIAAVADADLILMCYTPITEKVIAAAPKLRGIVKYGVGVDAIDIEAAQRRRIPVVNIPAYAEETVAEGAFLLMLASARKLGAMHCRMREKGWLWPTPEWLGHDLSGKTLGLVGVGRIGRCLARMAHSGFRMRVLGFDPYVDIETMQRFAVERCERLEDLLAQSDFVSLHAVLNPSTRGLIGQAQLAAMKSSALRCFG